MPADVAPDPRANGRSAAAAELVATCARGTESLVAEELRAEGVVGVEPLRGAVRFGGGLADGYRACLWSRVASRVLRPIGVAEASSPEALYESVRQIAWLDHLGPEQTLAVECVGRGPVRVDEGAAGGRPDSPRYLALKVKDAIVDRLRDETGARPSVDTRHPDVRVHVHLEGGAATVAVDLSGGALHERGYRPRGAAAPLRETLAAAVVRLSGWVEPGRGERAGRGDAWPGAPLIDPMCGTGTLLVEAAWMAIDRASGLLHARRLLRGSGWRGHDRALLEDLTREAEARERAGRARAAEAGVRLYGFDASGEAVAFARESVARAGVEGFVALARRDVSQLEPPPGVARSVLVVNPPYGERLGEVETLAPLYQTLGDVLKRRFGGSRAYVLVGEPALQKRLELRPSRKVPLWNGPIECRLLELPLTAPRAPVTAAGTSADGEPSEGAGPGWRKPSPEAEAFVNRLRKNRKRLAKWARRAGVECYRVYDADIPEYNVAIDLYGERALVQEYHRPRSVDPEVAHRRLQDVRLTVPDVLGVDPDRVALRVRRRQRDGGQYERGDASDRFVVHEGGHRFWVDLERYLDTGLFPDHRLLRAAIEREAQGKRFLNLFAYTCTASVYAAKGGAAQTVSVDLSSTYLDWGADNFRLNDLPEGPHRLERADCLRWSPPRGERYDLILLNPPSYSRSKGMEGDFDLCRDHAPLLRRVAGWLAPNGALRFSTHARGFELDRDALGGLHVEDTSAETVPEDYRRSPHHSFLVRR